MENGKHQQEHQRCAGVKAVFAGQQVETYGTQHRPVPTQQGGGVQEGADHLGSVHARRDDEGSSLPPCVPSSRTIRALRQPLRTRCDHSASADPEILSGLPDGYVRSPIPPEGAAHSGKSPNSPYSDQVKESFQPILLKETDPSLMRGSHRVSTSLWNSTVHDELPRRW